MLQGLCKIYGLVMLLYNYYFTRLKLCLLSAKD